ncbi:hypothetical protein KIL84_002291 [Mauremys mutica]|uniref:Uncharacterized protein n=1 Tax=Mauremys mutica TaxID=74926 RepID=A0A9D4AS54_9SAUR|nr:hypothetical protein KIL84_002291 [Mauremys mutica]
MAVCECLKRSLLLWPQGIGASKESRCSRVQLHDWIFCSNLIGSSCIIFEARRDSPLHANGELRAPAPELASRFLALFAYKRAFGPQVCLTYLLLALSEGKTESFFKIKVGFSPQNRCWLGGKWSLVRHPTKANCCLSSPGFPVALTESTPSQHCAARSASGVQ